MTDLPRRRASRSGLLRDIVGGLVSLGLSLDPMFLMWVTLEPSGAPFEESGPDDDELAAMAARDPAHADQPAAAPLAADHTTWGR